MAVLETRAHVAEGRLEEVRADLSGLRAEVKRMGEEITDSLANIAEQLHRHVASEDRDRVVLLRRTLWTLLSAIGALVAWGGPWVWQNLTTP